MAQVSIRYVDAAPDRFSFTLDGACPLGPATFRIDLTGSRAGLLIDMSGGGSVRELTVVSGAERVTALPQPQDGATEFEIELSEMVPGETIAVTIDLDDTRSARPTIIRGWEIEGVRAEISAAGASASAEFAASGVAVLPFSPCLS